MALRDLATHREDLVIMTDSLCTLQLINKMRRCPHLLKTAKHRELLESIIELIERRMVSGLWTGLCKVKSHIGIRLNELVDKAAKQMAEGSLPEGAEVVHEDTTAAVRSKLTWPAKSTLTAQGTDPSALTTG